ncbi:MAG TPA: hypothetical protein VKY37_04620 [Brumimicrobium sp.]|nr:hypothetical protein [Brumimicrobium sp.]
MKALLLIGFAFISFGFLAQEEENDLVQVKKAVITWADSTFYEYNEPRFEHFRANYTDEYLIATLRAKSLERSIRNLKKSYSSENYKGSNEEYENALQDLELRKKEAELNSVDFQPKVSSFQISFWANIKMDSGIYNYIKFNIDLDNDLNMVKNEISGRIGENRNAEIIYR